MKKILLCSIAMSSMVFAANDTTVNPYLTGFQESTAAMQNRWIKELSGQADATSIKKDVFVRQFIAPYDALFNKHAEVTQAEFIAFEMHDFDQTVQAHEDASIQQAHVRFGVLNKNKDSYISLKEFQDIGVQTFEKFDKNSDGIVNASDAALEDHKERLHGGAMFKSKVAMPVATDVKAFIAQHGQGQSEVTLAHYLTEREQLFIQTDANRDWVLSEDEYVNEFRLRYHENKEQAKSAWFDFYNARFIAIAQGKSTIRRKDLTRFANQLFVYWDKNKNGRLEINES